MPSRWFRLAYIALTSGLVAFVWSVAPAAYSAECAEMHSLKGQPKRHVVKSGEVLGAIAKRYGCTVPQLVRANKLKSADAIRVGQKLKVSDCATAASIEDLVRQKPIEHCVLEGQSLGSIAKRYKTSVKAIQKANKRLIKKRNRGNARGVNIRFRDRLKVTPGPDAEQKERHVEDYEVFPGDTLWDIARRFGGSHEEILCINPQIKRPNFLRWPQTIKVVRYGFKSNSTTVGTPQNGKLLNGVRMRPVRARGGYHLRKNRRHWGTAETIRELTKAILSVKKKVPGAHDIAVGDISSEHGGPLKGHRSHQSGRDVDLGLYFKAKKLHNRGVGPKRFISGLKHELDLEANWVLIESLVGKSKAKSGVNYIFLDYDVQRMIYDWVVKNKRASKAQLNWIFQYPKGKRAHHGIVRHWKYHADHYHIRFRCPPDDKGCKF